MTRNDNRKHQQRVSPQTLATIFVLLGKQLLIDMLMFMDDIISNLIDISFEIYKCT